MDPGQILQTYLNAVGEAVMVDDWPTYSAAVSLPCLILTSDESKVVASLDELRAGFDLFRDTLRLQRVTDYVRLVEHAAQAGPGLISGRYVTHVISASQRVVYPFRSHMTLRQFGANWRAVSVTNSLPNSRWPLVRLASDADEPPKGPET